MHFDLLIDAPAFWNALVEDLHGARKQVYLQAMTFEADSVGKSLARELTMCAAQDRRVLIDSFSRYMINDRFVLAPRNCLDSSLWQERTDTMRMVAGFRQNGVSCRFTNPPGLLPHRILARNHKKLIVMDDRIAYVGGLNFSEHNFAWHDMMLRLESPEIAAFFKEDFLATWHGRNQSRRHTTEGFDFLLCDGRRNHSSYVPIFAALDEAREEIFVECPYLTFPIFDRLRAARRRGARVIILMSGVNNWRVLRHYIPWEAHRSDIELRVYTGRFTHLKSILIDRERLIFGSANYEFLSYSLHQEIMAMTSRTDIVAEFIDEVLKPDMAASVSADSAVSSIRGHLRYRQLQVLSHVLGLLTLSR